MIFILIRLLKLGFYILSFGDAGVSGRCDAEGMLGVAFCLLLALGLFIVSFMPFGITASTAFL